MTARLLMLAFLCLSAGCAHVRSNPYQDCTLFVKRYIDSETDEVVRADSLLVCPLPKGQRA